MPLGQCPSRGSHSCFSPLCAISPKRPRRRRPTRSGSGVRGQQVLEALEWPAIKCRFRGHVDDPATLGDPLTGISKFSKLDFVMKGGEVIGAVRLAALVLLLI